MDNADAADSDQEFISDKQLPDTTDFINRQINIPLLVAYSKCQNEGSSPFIGDVQ